MKIFKLFDKKLSVNKKETILFRRALTTGGTQSGTSTPTSRTKEGRTRRRSAPPDTYDNVNGSENKNNQ